MHLIQQYMKFANTARLYFPHLTILRNQTLQFYNFLGAPPSCGDRFSSSRRDRSSVNSWNNLLVFQNTWCLLQYVYIQYKNLVSLKTRSCHSKSLIKWPNQNANERYEEYLIYMYLCPFSTLIFRRRWRKISPPKNFINCFLAPSTKVQTKVGNFQRLEGWTSFFSGKWT